MEKIEVDYRQILIKIINKASKDLFRDAYINENQFIEIQNKYLSMVERFFDDELSNEIVSLYCSRYALFLSEFKKKFGNIIYTDEYSKQLQEKINQFNIIFLESFYCEFVCFISLWYFGMDCKVIFVPEERMPKSERKKIESQLKLEKENNRDKTIRFNLKKDSIRFDGFKKQFLEQLDKEKFECNNDQNEAISRKHINKKVHVCLAAAIM